MHAVDKDLASVNLNKGLLNAAFSHAHGLYLSACKLDTRLIGIFYK